jgi:hypothetical protein
MAARFLPKTVDPTSTYWESFKILYQDFEDSFRYVYPHPNHLDVYSLRYYELLLRACTEFESLCKQKVIEMKLSPKYPRDMNITDYYLLADPLKITNYAVGYHFEPAYFTVPLNQWKHGHKLPWYQDYNEVKHNRVTEFKRANLRNVLDAVGALFLLIMECQISPHGTVHYLKDGGSMVNIIEGWPLLMRKSLAEK